MELPPSIASLYVLADMAARRQDSVLTDAQLASIMEAFHRHPEYNPLYGSIE